MKLTVLIVLAVAATYDCSPREPVWNDLRVTWGMDPTDPNYFVSLPRTSIEAEDHRWVKISDCNPKGKFLGHRYTHEEDHNIILLFDDNGVIAGIQAGALISEITAGGNYYDFEADPKFQVDVVHGRPVYLLTVYFVDPAIICEGGRSMEEFLLQGTGTGVRFQIGPNPNSDILEIPMKAEDCSDAGWSKNKCFPSMGVHWHYNYTYDTSARCEDLVPLFMLYTKGTANGFGFQSLGNVHSKRWEDPGKMAIYAIFKSPPQCLFEAAETFGLSTMHVYLQDHPWYISC